MHAPEMPPLGEGYSLFPIYNLPNLPTELTGVYVLLKSGPDGSNEGQAILVDCAISRPIAEAIRSKLTDPHVGRHRPDFVALRLGPHVDHVTIDDCKAMVHDVADISDRLKPVVAE